MPPALPKYIAAYYATLQSFADQRALTEGATRIAFQTLLAAAGKPLGLTVLAEQTVALPSRRRIRLDGEVRDQYKIRRGIWEAKDAADDLDAAITQKIAAGYPLKNTLFENTRRAVLYQNGGRTLDLDITAPANLQLLLAQFLGYAEPLVAAFHQAVAQFRTEIPVLAAGLREIIEREKAQNAAFRGALAAFVTMCRASLNPTTSEAEVEDLLVQHLLTERIFRSVFENDAFVQRNVIAREIEMVITALTSRAFSRRAFLGKLDYFYQAIEEAARSISDYSEKQTFLNTVYEQFFQAYSTDTADTHGIVYTPAPLVRWMVAAVEEVLGRDFGTSLADQGVHILDPCVGTGTFLLELMEHIGPSSLPDKYARELHCNEVLLLPYYIASQNIEHEYYERTGQYAPFEGICFTDTLDLAENRQASFFAEENTARVEEQRQAPIMVVLGNPPYNVGQKNENDNNKNRRYPVVDGRIRETYAKDSRATNKNALSDQYVKFFRWAADRLEGRDGVVCFVSNNSFVDQLTFDGMRKHLLQDFTAVYHLDLHGNVRKNPKLSGTTHNVFGIQVGVGITVAVRRASHPARTLQYFRVPELWTRAEKLDFLAAHPGLTQIDWQPLQPDARHTWPTAGLSDDFATFLPMGSKADKLQRNVGGGGGYGNLQAV